MTSKITCLALNDEIDPAFTQLIEINVWGKQRTSFLCPSCRPHFESNSLSINARCSNFGERVQRYTVHLYTVQRYTDAV